MIAIDPVISLAVRYKSALRAFLNGAGESALQEAYDLGRQAMTEGLGALDLARIHKESLMDVIEETESKERNAELVEGASAFFLESLATFEMTHRGFQESLAILSTRTAELELANRTLEAEIKERRRIQEALKNSEERYRSLIDNALDVIYTISTDGTISSLNPAFDLITGWPREEWIGKPFLPLVHHEDVDYGMAIYRRTLSGETPPVHELRIKSRSGEYLIGEFRATPQWRNGSVVGVLGIARDITKRRKAEEQLRFSQGQLAEAQEIANLGNWEWDVQKNTLTWSDVLYRVFGVDRATFTLTFDSYLSLIHPEDRVMVRNIIESAAKNRKPFSFHHRLVRPDGTVRICHSRGVIVTGSNNEVVRMFGTGQDVTETKQAEEVLRELPNRILNAQEEERRRLARELHDDVCQRLSGMRLGIDVLESDSENDKRLVKKIEETKKQIDHIIGDIRRISMNLRPTTLDDLGLVVAIRKLCNDIRSTYKCSVRFSAQKSIPLHFEKNAEIALYRIVQESIMNAVKHGQPSDIRISLKYVNGKILAKIVDNGKGFDPSKPHPQKPGHGLGLLSMKERAHLLQGKIRIESEPFRGTVITAEFPLNSHAHTAH